MNNTTSNLRMRYIIGLSAIALITIIAQVVIQVQIVRQESDANVINIAGRQRMLSQRISKEALLFQATDADAELLGQLESTLTLWETSHLGLQSGNDELELPGNNSTVVSSMFEDITPHFDAIRQAANCLVNPDISACGTSAENVDIILANEGDFLAGMNSIVFQYAEEAKQEVLQLRLVEFGLLVLMMFALVMEAMLIFRPAELQIRTAFEKTAEAQNALQNNNERLEVRVAQRTQQLAQTNNKLQQSNEDLVTFSRLLVHDLKSPVMIAKGFTRELNEDWRVLTPHFEKQEIPDSDTDYIINESIPDSIQSLEKSINQMEGLLKQVGQLSQDGRRELVIHDLNVEEIVNDVLGFYETQLTTKNIKIEIGALPTVKADQFSVERAFNNLISNAIKYLEPTRQSKIKIYGKDVGDYISYYVEDNGRGIPENEHNRVFEMFRRAGNTSNIEGDGIGLYTIRNLIRRQGGLVNFESTANIGSTFYFSIPKDIAEITNDIA